MTAAALLVVHLALTGPSLPQSSPPDPPATAADTVMTGTVRDESGRVVPGASVIAAPRRRRRAAGHDGCRRHASR